LNEKADVVENPVVADTPIIEKVEVEDDSVEDAAAVAESEARRA
jgi:hypothetical protein